MYNILQLYLWQRKPIYLDNKRNVESEMIDCYVDMDLILEIFETGNIVRRRRKGIIEKWKRYGKWIVIVVMEEHLEFWSVRHVSRIRSTRKKIRLMRGE